MQPPRHDQRPVFNQSAQCITCAHIVDNQETEKWKCSGTTSWITTVTSVSVPSKSRHSRAAVLEQTRSHCLHSGVEWSRVRQPGVMGAAVPPHPSTGTSLGDATLGKEATSCVQPGG